MTPPDDDRPDGPDHDLYDETPPRSIFSATWVRIVLVLIVVGVVGAVTVPYILDAMNPPTKSTVSRAMPTPSTPSITPPASAPAPSTAPSPPVFPAPPAPAPPPSAEKPAAPPDRPAALAEKSAAMAEKPPAVADKPAVVPDKPAPPIPRKPLAGDAAADKAEKPAAPAKPPATEKSADKVVASATQDKPKPAAKPSTAVKSDDAPATKRAAARSTAGTSTAGWWVQVGAFRDHETASKLVAKLREEKYDAEESTREGASKSTASDKSAPSASGSAPAGSDLYDVFVSGVSTAELNKRLSAKGLAAETSGNNAVIKPSLPLRDAVALSKDLAVDGLKVQVRRAGSGAPDAARAAPAKPAERVIPADSGATLYRVRVGAFPDRASAVTALKELEAKGYKPFIARGQ